MKNFSSLLTLLFFACISFTSCSKIDIIKETLTVKANVNGTDFEKSFTVNENSVFTDAKGFIIELKWTSEGKKLVDLDLLMDAQSEAGNIDTGFDKNYSKASSTYEETMQIENQKEDTFGKTHITVYTSGEDTINYVLTIRNISDNKIIKTKTGSIQATIDAVDNPYVESRNHRDKSYGFETLGTFVKVGNKFHFGYE